MRLEKASAKAIKYACLKFHYSKVCPAHAFGYSVFNKKNEWCGVILFGGGAGAFMGSPFGLKYGQYLELNRMALNGKQESTSKAMSIAINLIKKHNPTVKLLISYADKGQDHIGTIYQATNWYFVDESKSSGEEVFYKGKWCHNRMSSNVSKEYYKKLPKRKKPGKYKYIYPLNKKILPLCNKLGKPYPKKAIEVHELNTLHSSKEVGGANPTQSLKKNLN
jgi:hypothetical protein